jgi:hypothetical protein
VGRGFKKIKSQFFQNQGKSSSGRGGSGGVEGEKLNITQYQI